MNGSTERHVADTSESVEAGLQLFRYGLSASPQRWMQAHTEVAIARFLQSPAVMNGDFAALLSRMPALRSMHVKPVVAITRSLGRVEGSSRGCRLAGLNIFLARARRFSP
jgi:hypothetical protein